MKSRLRNWFIALAAIAATGTLTRAIIVQEGQAAGLSCADAQVIVNHICDDDDGQSADCIGFVEWIIPAACGITVQWDCAVMGNGDLCRFGRIMSGPSWDGTGYIACDSSLGDPVPCTARQGLHSKPRSFTRAFAHRRVKALIRRVRNRLSDDLAAKIPDA